MNKDVAYHIGEMVREIRKTKGISQEQLAEAVGTKHTDIGRLERGERNVTIKTLEKIASELDVEIYDLFAYVIRSKITGKEFSILEINRILSDLPEVELNKILTVLKAIYENSTG